MKWEEFLSLTLGLPVIDTEILLAGKPGHTAEKVQISRWEKAGKLIKLRKGAYILSEAYRKIEPYPVFVASTLKSPSYLSLEKALEYHGLIPEGVPVYTSVTPKRQARFTSKAGTYSYRHIKKELFWGYESATLNRQTGFVARPEKALLDLIYLNGVKVTSEFLSELRLQSTDKINARQLFKFAKKSKIRKLIRDARTIADFIGGLQKEEKAL